MAQAAAYEQDGVTRLVLRGELDLADYDSLSAVMRRLQAPRPRVLAIDLREVVYIDSTGVRWLIEANEWARGAGCRMFVIHTAAAAVTRVISLCRLEEVLDLIEDASAVPA